MKCPKCGNLNAECVIGNFWKCPSCDKPKKPFPSSPAELSSALGVDIDPSPSPWFLAYLGTLTPRPEILKLSREFIKHLHVGAYFTRGGIEYKVLAIDDDTSEVAAERL